MKSGVANLIYDHFGKSKIKNFGGTEAIRDRIIKLSVTNYRGEEYLVAVDFYVDTSWSRGTARFSALYNSMRFSRDFFSDPNLAKAEEFNIAAYGEFTDKYGQPSEDPLWRVNFSRPLADKINWDSMDNDRWKHLLSTEKGAGYWFHRDLRK